MKFLISNLRLLARRFKSVAIINVVGLGVAFAVTLVVAKQVWYDLTYDRGYANSDEIFLLELDWGTGGGPMAATNQQLPRVWAERIPEIRAYTLVGGRPGGKGDNMAAAGPRYHAGGLVGGVKPRPLGLIIHLEQHLSK
jgi:hypothetical protein